MGDTYMVSGLIRNRAELAGLKAQAKDRLAEIGAQLACVDGCLRLFGFTDFASIRPKRAPGTPRVSRAESKARYTAILRALREAPDGLPTPELARVLAGA